MEESVVVVKEDKSSLHHFVIHLQPFPHLQALVETEDITLDTCSKFEEVLLIYQERAWNLNHVSQITL